MARVKIEVPVEHKPSPALNTHFNETSHLVRQGKSLSVKTILILLLVVALSAFIFNLMNDRNRLKKELDSSASSQEVTDVIRQISKSVELPTDETPQLRTIEDASKFKQGSQVLDEINDGDVWIFYPKAGKQIFYRPDTNKVIFVVPLTPTTDTNQLNSN